MLRLPYRHTVSAFLRSEIRTWPPSQYLRVRCLSYSTSFVFDSTAGRRWCNFYDKEWPETPYKMPDALWTPAEVSAILFNSFGEPMAAIQYLASSKPREIGEAIEDAVSKKPTKPFAVA